MTLTTARAARLLVLFLGHLYLALTTWRDNSNARPLEGNLRLRWTRTLRDFQHERLNQALGGRPSDDTGEGIRSDTLSVRGGRILVMVPMYPPEAYYEIWVASVNYSSYGIFSMADGQLLMNTVTPQLNGNGSAALRREDFGHFGFEFFGIGQ